MAKFAYGILVSMSMVGTVSGVGHFFVGDVAGGVIWTLINSIFLVWWVGMYHIECKFGGE